jgi:hypothetical protein
VFRSSVSRDESLDGRPQSTQLGRCATLRFRNRTFSTRGGRRPYAQSTEGADWLCQAEALFAWTWAEMVEEISKLLETLRLG